MIFFAAIFIFISWAVSTIFSSLTRYIRLRFGWTWKFLTTIHYTVHTYTFIYLYEHAIKHFSHFQILHFVHKNSVCIELAGWLYDNRKNGKCTASYFGGVSLDFRSTKQYSACNDENIHTRIHTRCSLPIKVNNASTSKKIDNFTIQYFGGVCSMSSMWTWIK